MVDKNLTTGIMYPGGQSLNIPVNMHFLGAQAAFIGCFGNDYVAEHMKKTLDEIGIDYSHSHTYPVPNACAHYRVIDNDRVFVRPPKKVNPMTPRAVFHVGLRGVLRRGYSVISNPSMLFTAPMIAESKLTIRISRRRGLKFPLTFL